MRPTTKTHHGSGVPCTRLSSPVLRANDRLTARLMKHEVSTP